MGPVGFEVDDALNTGPVGFNLLAKGVFGFDLRSN